MGRYIVRRLLQMIPVLLGATFLIFAMVYALPGDPIRPLSPATGRCPPASPQLREEFNLNDPLLVQYVKYLGNLLQGDLGDDFRGPGHRQLARGYPVTVKLAARRDPLRDRSSASPPASSPASARRLLRQPRAGARPSSSSRSRSSSSAFCRSTSSASSSGSFPITVHRRPLGYELPPARPGARARSRWPTSPG